MRMAARRSQVLRDPAAHRARAPSRSAPLLPSFLYLPAAGELPADALTLPWGERADAVVGEFAQQRGSEVPDRVVASAKSWLSHAGADRTAPILPWGSPRRRAASSRRSRPRRATSPTSRAAWNAAFPDAPLAEQDVLLTVPASFDAVARELTVRAAHDAGLPQVTLLEEPQAALYAWIDANGEALARSAVRGRRRRSWSATSAAARPTSA